MQRAYSRLALAAPGKSPAGIRPTMHPGWLRCSFIKYGPDIFSRRALPSGRLVGLGARRAFHHGLLGLCLAVSVLPVTAWAQSAENVAVVINDDSPDSKTVGEHYVRARAIPETNVIRIHTPIADTINRSAYINTIEAPIRAALMRHRLQDRVLYIVLIKGVPLRIDGTEGTEGHSASVDSELTLLYRRMVGKATPPPGRIANPYFLGNAPVGEAKSFSHRQYDMYLVTRLDGFTAADAIALVDRGLKPVNDGQLVLDLNGGFKNSPLGDLWLESAGRQLSAMGWGKRVVVEKTSTPVRDVDNVLGYASWASNDPQNRVRRTEMRFAPGAIATTFASADARTFQEPPAEWIPSGNWQNRTTWFAGAPDTLVGDLIREGVTGVAGSVSDPYLQSAVRPSILFPAYVTGFNLAEAFYLAIPHLSWKTVVIGDPLCKPFPRPAMTAADIEDPIDETTELPALFSKRRVEAVRAAVKELPADGIVPVVLAESRLARDDRAGARGALEKLLELAPELPGAQMRLALLYEQDSDTERAVDLYRKILVKQPNNVIALNNLAYAIAVKQNAPAEAKPLAQKAAVLAPRDANIADTLAWIEHLLGNRTSAETLIATALKNGPESADVRLHAAFIFAVQQPDSARTHLDAAYALNPELKKRDDVQELEQRLAKR